MLIYNVINKLIILKIIVFYKKIQVIITIIKILKTKKIWGNLDNITHDLFLIGSPS